MSITVRSKEYRSYFLRSIEPITLPPRRVSQVILYGYHNIRKEHQLWQIPLATAYTPLAKKGVVLTLNRFKKVSENRVRLLLFNFSFGEIILEEDEIAVELFQMEGIEPKYLKVLLSYECCIFPAEEYMDHRYEFNAEVHYVHFTFPYKYPYISSALGGALTYGSLGLYPFSDSVMPCRLKPDDPPVECKLTLFGYEQADSVGISCDEDECVFGPFCKRSVRVYFEARLREVCSTRFLIKFQVNVGRLCCLNDICDLTGLDKIDLHFMNDSLDQCVLKKGDNMGFAFILLRRPYNATRKYTRR